MSIDKMDLNAALDAALDPPAPAAPTEKAEAPSEPEETADETPDETPVAPEATDDEDDALEMTAEDLAAIKADPKLRAIHKNMNRAFTQKTMSLAQDRQILDALKNPATRANAIKIIATNAGLKLQEEAAAAPRNEVEKVVDARLEQMNSIFDPAVSKALKPILEGIASDVVAATLAKEVAPLQEATTALSLQAYQAQSLAEVQAFRQRHPEASPAVEAKMVALFEELPPHPSIDPSTYVEYLYKIAKDDTTKAAATKEVTTRMAKAATSQEPKAGMPANRVVPARDTQDKDFDRRFDSAWEESKSGR